MSDTDGKCPRCGSARVTYHGAQGAGLMYTCDCCDHAWGDTMGHAAAVARIRAEEVARPRPPAFRDCGDIYLPGVNPWWFI